MKRKPRIFYPNSQQTLVCVRRRRGDAGKRAQRKAASQTLHGATIAGAFAEVGGPKDCGVCL